MNDKLSYLIIFICFFILLIPLFNKFLPKWFCTVGWHLEPKEVDAVGINNVGICPRCGKMVIQDSQGNWF